MPETERIAPSARPAKVPAIAAVPVLLMIVNFSSGVGVKEALSVVLSVALLRLMVPPACNWL